MEETLEAQRSNTLYSSSYPPDIICSSRIQHSQIHSIIRKNPHITQSSINYRLCLRQDIPEVSKLFQEWFPLNYSKQLYDAFTNTIHCALATITCEISEIKRQLIVGIIAWRLDDINEFVQKDSILDYFFTKQRNLYIMSLGVIDEFRGKGIAKKLIHIVEKEANANRNIKCISLHVLSTNTSAIQFYQKLGFEFMRLLNLYGACYYMKFVNGGKKAISKSFKL